MEKRVLGIFIIFCLFLSVFVGLPNKTSAVGEVWSDWSIVASPQSTFFNGIGSWAQSNVGNSVVYTGKGSKPGEATIYSFTSFGKYQTTSQAITSFTNYKVKFTTTKPSSISSPYYPKIIVGNKNTDASPISSSAFVVDIKSTGLEINQFGSINWNGVGSNYIYWSTLVPGGIAAGAVFTFEIDVTSSQIQIFINDVLKYTVTKASIPATFNEIGLFGLGGSNVTTAAGVSFTSISYSTYETPAPTDVPVDVPLSVDISSVLSNQILVDVAGLKSGEKFQVWTYEQNPEGASIFGGAGGEGTGTSTGGGTGSSSAGSGTGNGSQNDMFWAPAKFFDDMSRVSAGADGVCHFVYDVPAANWTSDGRYQVYVRIIGSTGGMLLQERATVATISGTVAIKGITIDGQPVLSKTFFIKRNLIQSTVSIRMITSSTLSETDTLYYHFMRSGITAIGDETTPEGWFTLQNSASDTCTLAIPSTGAMYTIKVRAYTFQDPLQNFSEHEFALSIPAADTPFSLISEPSFGDKKSMQTGDYFALNLTGKTSGSIGNDPRFKFLISEMWQPPIMTQQYSSNKQFTRQITSPGIYLLQTYVSHSAHSSYDDGILKWITVSRKSNSSYSGFASINSCDIKVNGSSTGFSAIENPSFNNGSSRLTIASGDQVTFNAIGTGLMGDGITPLSKTSPSPSSSYLYSFYRLDQNGYREIKSWNTSSSLSWRPFAPGNYSILVRIRGIDAQSYEDQRSYNFLVSGGVDVGDLSYTTSLNSYVDNSTINPALARESIEITANVSGIEGFTTTNENVLYRFEVWDAFMGNITIRDFSYDPSVIWVPRKAGVYRFTIRAQDSSSFGFGDRVINSEDFVVG